MKQFYLFSYPDSETCLKGCCIRHGLPAKCLEETMDTQTDSHHNSSHVIVKMVISKECHDYKSVMEECKSECIEKEGKKSTYDFEIVLPLTKA